MYPKHKCEQLVKVLAPKIIDLLELDSYHIKIYVEKSTNPILHKNKICVEGDKGCCCINNKKIDIYLFWNTQEGKKDTIGTIVHELFHVRINKLTSLISSKNQKKADKAEEAIVQYVETLFLSAIK